MSEFAFSPTEEAGIAAMPQNAEHVLSVGISTGGVAEMRMVEQNPRLGLIATTVDEAGLSQAKEMIAAAGLSSKIDARLEDVSQPLPYPAEYFDYIYARLVLHYLSKQALDSTLTELKRVLKPSRQLFVVVRSVDCPDAHSEGATYDEATGFTTYQHPVSLQGEQDNRSTKRYFHTEESIRDHMVGAGFKVEYVKSLNEQLFADFMRKTISPHTDRLVELLVTKED
ncbi:MAG: class I SAM-dependent methyltransferase [Candidatus Saccharimonadales bacterium]